MASGSLGTKKNSKGEGLTDLGHRKILKALYPNVGIIEGLTVTPNQNLTYHVSGGVGVGSLGDGNRIFYTDGGNTGSVSPGDSSNRRIDTVYAKIHDPVIDSDSVDVELGVLEGTPSNSPVSPTLPLGCVLLMSFMIQPGSTNLANGSSRYGSANYVVPYGSSLHDIVKKKMDGYYLLPNDGKQYDQFGNVTFSIPTDRNLNFRFYGRCCIDKLGIRYQSFSGELFIDGISQNNGTRNDADVTDSWTIRSLEWNADVEAGEHTINLNLSHDGNSVPFPNTAPIRFMESRNIVVSDNGVIQ